MRSLEWTAENRSWHNATIPAVLREAGAEYGAATAVSAHDGRLSFADLYEQATDVAAALITAGVRPGDRVALLMPPSTRWAAVQLGVMCSGAVSCPLNPSLHAAELADQLARCSARVLIVDLRYRGGQSGVRALNALGRLGPEASIQLVGVGAALPDGFVDLMTLIAARDEVASAVVAQRVRDRAPDVLSVVIFTSGSSGRPKPAMLNDAAILGGAWFYGESVALDATDRVLVPYPTYHVSAFVCGILVPLLRGRPAWMLESFDAGHALGVIEAEGITTLWGFDTTYLMLLQHEAFSPERVRTVVRAGSTTRPGMIDRLFDALPGLKLVSRSYAMTETTGPTTVVLPSETDPEHRKYGAGSPLPGASLRIVALDGAPCPAGVPGEIRVRGPHVFLGYLDDPVATADAFDEDGWLKTGDLGHLDDHGRLYYEGRLKRMIKSGGENVSELEVESFLEERVQGVALAQVVGVPDPFWVETVVAFVEPATGATLDEAKVIAVCKAELANFKVPKRVVRMTAEDWPRNDIGKIAKDVLIQMAAPPDVSP